MLDSEKDQFIEAEIQKRLTKAVPFLRGKLTQNLGLRYAPEIRFYRDNSLEIFDQFREQARQYLRETNKEQQSMGVSSVPKESMDLLQKIKTYRKMDNYQRRIEVNNCASSQQKAMLVKLLFNEGELDRVENQLKDMIEQHK